jgi:membrane-associated phospholipid phosphatase
MVARAEMLNPAQDSTAVFFVTDFADQALILPVVLLAGLALLLLGWPRGAASWALSAGGTCAVLLALKLFGAACPAVTLGGVLPSPSGHAGAATMAYGGLAALLLRRRAAGLAVAAAVAALIGVSRVQLQMHTVPEAAFGAAVGLLGVLALLLLAGPRPPGIAQRAPAVLAAVVAVVVLLHGERLNAEGLIHRAAVAYLRPLLACWG